MELGWNEKEINLFYQMKVKKMAQIKHIKKMIKGQTNIPKVPNKVFLVTRLTFSPKGSLKAFFFSTLPSVNPFLFFICHSILSIHFLKKND